MPDRVEPFVSSVAESAPDDLRGRLRRARWPGRETAGDWSQGVPLGYPARPVRLLGGQLRLAGRRSM